MKIVALLPVVVCACAGAAPAPAQSEDAPVASVSAAPQALPPADAPRPDRFPAGPGVTLVNEDLDALLADPKATSTVFPYEDRIAFARGKLGVQGEPEIDSMYDGLSFVAIGASGMGGPYSCQELILSKKSPPWTKRSTDNRRCGLPYLEDSTKRYRGGGPRWTVARLRLMLVELQGMDALSADMVARKKLGPPEPATDPPEWRAIGPRGRDAPFTCHVLALGSPPKVFEAPVERCGLTWPPPASRFDPGPAVPAIDKPAVVAACQKTCGQDLCMITQKNEPGTSLRPEPDGLRARYADGRPAKTELHQSCLPIPATCSAPPTSACFFPPAPNAPPGTNNGPCPKEDFSGFSFQGAPPHIECYARYKAAP